MWAWFWYETGAMAQSIESPDFPSDFEDGEQEKDPFAVSDDDNDADFDMSESQRKPNPKKKRVAASQKSAAAKSAKQSKSSKSSKASEKSASHEKLVVSIAEKKQLAGIIEKEEVIWDLSNQHHRNNNAVTSAWNRVAEQMGKTGSFIFFN